MSADRELRIIRMQHPVEFQAAVNELLETGDWRIVNTEMSETDHQYVAMMVRKSTTGAHLQTESEAND